MKRESAAGVTGSAKPVAWADSPYAVAYWAAYHSLLRLNRRGFPCHTATVLALALCTAFNLLSLLNLLWGLRLMANPYVSHGPDGQYRALALVLVIAMELNVVLAVRTVRKGEANPAARHPGRAAVRGYLTLSFVAWALTCCLGMVTAG